MSANTEYALSGEVSIAYQVTGQGPDLVMIPGFASHLEMDWAGPEFAVFLERLSSFSRLIRLDKRGTGLSDPVAHLPTLEERMEDARAVMDAAGSERATLFGYSEGGSMAALFAATYPERTAGLILYGTFPNWSELPDTLLEQTRNAVAHWGEGKLAELLGPSIASEARRKLMFGTYERIAASPGMARALLAALEQTDVRPILPQVRVPTLVLHRRDEFFPLEAAREIANLVEDGRLVTLEGSDHLPHLGDSGAVVGEIEEFLTGARTAPPPQRALATVMFTDIVGSTRHAAKVGDEAWSETLRAHNDLTRECVSGFGGRPIKSTGDGFLATFDGPARAIECARALIERVSALDLQLRAGVHTGECEWLDDDVAGMAVHISARISAQAQAGEILVSSTVRDLVVGSGIGFADAGEHELKGVPGRWRVLKVEPDAQPAPRQVDNTALRRPGDRLSTTLARRAPGLTRRALRRMFPSEGTTEGNQEV